jgi:hypothetical protein
MARWLGLRLRRRGAGIRDRKGSRKAVRVDGYVAQEFCGLDDEVTEGSDNGARDPDALDPLVLAHEFFVNWRRRLSAVDHRLIGF